jgi:hypothetical protein
LAANPLGILIDGGKSMVSSQDERLRVYEQLCNSYRAIDDFRAKLLGFLPLASGTGIFLILTKDVGPALEKFSLPIGVFGFFITLGLLCYEIYGIKKCGALIEAGRALEDLLNVENGQFNKRPREAFCLINEPFATAIIYPAVLAAWTWLGLYSTCNIVATFASIFVFLLFFVFTIIYDICLRKMEDIKKCKDSTIKRMIIRIKPLVSRIPECSENTD